ncbi:hypothetical protein [Nonomuraea typhae]|uniref:hypothetical protein n=1 Tax=Nonomuraea typhae TaxID=2603600 RepID=UPI0012F9F65D|nr:hypothetical protein [Nonomuraea typhae]
MVDGIWTPWARAGDVPALIAKVREILDQLDRPLKVARRKIAQSEGAARLRASSRTRTTMITTEEMP